MGLPTNFRVSNKKSGSACLSSKAAKKIPRRFEADIMSPSLNLFALSEYFLNLEELIPITIFAPMSGLATFRLNIKYKIHSMVLCLFLLDIQWKDSIRRWMHF